MKKNIYIVVFLLSGISSMLTAQNKYTLQSKLNNPREGDSFVKEQVAYRKPDMSGTNCVWDLSNLTEKGEYSVEYFSRDDFSLMGAENKGLIMYSLSEDSLLMKGYENSNNLVLYGKAALLMKFPLFFGATTESVFRGRGKHNDQMESVVTGKIHTAADASGSLILPGNDTLNNVIRIHIHKIEYGYHAPISSTFDINEPVDDVLISDSLSKQTPDEIVTDTYQWYEEGYRYPVFETVASSRRINGENYSLRQESYLYHPLEQTWLPEDTANLAVLDKKQLEKERIRLEKESKILFFDCYPNPVRESLSVELSVKQTTALRLSLLDAAGRELYRSEIKNRSGFIKETLNMNVYPAGTYFINVSNGKEKLTEKIVKL